MIYHNFPQADLKPLRDYEIFKNKCPRKMKVTYGREEGIRRTIGWLR